MKTFGNFTDTRDGETYRTVKIGNQIWLAENLRYKCDGSYAYDDDEANVAKYGRLYTWDAAKLAVPARWRLPTDLEWQTLVDFVGGDDVAGTKLKSQSGWSYNGGGTDDYRFSALPGGYRDSDRNFYFCGVNGFGYWWSATEFDAILARYWFLYSGYSRVRKNLFYNKYALSVRCLRD